MQAEERRAEVEWALARMWEVAKGDEQVGAQWVLTFWSQGGALTLLSWGRTTSGEKTGHPVDREAFMSALRGLLTSHWQVVRAETLRSALPDEAVTDVLREYRQLHAELFRRYREEMVDSVVLAGTFTLEQVALTVIGGLIGKGLHVTFEAAAPTLVKMFARGGTGAVQWFRAQEVCT